MIRVLVSDSLVRKWIHTTCHWHLSVVRTGSHHLVLSHNLLLRHTRSKLISLIRSWLLLHVREYRIQSADNIVGFWLNDGGSWLLLLLLLLLLHLLVLHELLLNAHLHSLLLLLHHGRVHHWLAHHVWLHGGLLLHHGRLRLRGHERVRLLGTSRLHQICLGLHSGWLRLLSWLLVAIAAHHVKEIDICCRRLLRRW